MTGNRPPACDQVAQELCELALGSLNGRDRARVLAHLGQCPACAAELEHLSALADELILLAPAAEPPVGFEVALVRRLELEASRESPAPSRSPGPPPRSSRSRRRWPVFAAAALVALGLAFGGGWLASSANSGPVAPPGAAARATPARPGSSERWAQATFTSHGHAVGRLVLVPGQPAWLLVSVHDLGPATWVRCEVTTTAGTAVTVGMFPLTAGGASWGAPVEVRADQVRSAVLVGAGGAVVAAAGVSW